MPHPWIKYWRNSLADASRSKIEVSKNIYRSDFEINWETGLIEESIAMSIIDEFEVKHNEEKNITDRESRNWIAIGSVSVLVAFFYVTPVVEHGTIRDNGSEEDKYKQRHFPFWIRAVLNRAGQLSVGDEVLPYVVRDYLDPPSEASMEYLFSSVETVDEVLSDYLEDNDWSSYKQFVEKIFTKLTHQEMRKYTPDIWHMHRENTIIVHQDMRRASDEIIKLYDAIDGQEVLPRCLRSFIDENYSPVHSLLKYPQILQISFLNHFGQMGRDLSLTFSQRLSLYQFLNDEDDPVFAINGPPGTGKTTLLQSVIATMTVQSAIKGKKPFLIAAASTNNQAVTNIRDSFASLTTSSELLYQRWLPDINSFALYLPGSTKDMKTDIHFHRYKEGLEVHCENREYLDRATKLFLSRSKEYLKNTDKSIPNNSILNNIKSLRKEIRTSVAKLKNGLRYWKFLINVKQKSQLADITSGELSTEKYVEQFISPANQQKLRQIEDACNQYLLKEPFLLKLFSFLRIVKQQRIMRFEAIFRDCPYSHSHIVFPKLNSINLYFRQLYKELKKTSGYYKKWKEWKEVFQINANPPENLEEWKQSASGTQVHFFDEMDKSIRYKLFYLSVHYWEGRWIIEAENHLKKESHLSRWYRLSMLTPCNVSTFYMLPKNLKKDKRTFLLNSLDLLIVDEAGQVSPEVGSASFALAKKALVIGDTQQIEPVWNISKRVDLANLYKFGLVNSSKLEESEERREELDHKGYCAGSGNIMTLAQKSARVQAHEKMRGMMLTEHWRCYDEIIQYCNTLAYDGLLVPRRGKSPVDRIFHPMLFIAVDGESGKEGSSRFNQLEAESILDWVVKNKEELLNRYNQSHKGSWSIGDILGIITPFSSQKKLLKNKFSGLGKEYEGISVGTVHTFQGAERPIILFSSVYGSNDKGGTFFFDIKVNMLNVAVSRAKDRFIIFGNEQLYKANISTYSGALYHYILPPGSND